jgi:hypothetical protein
MVVDAAFAVPGEHREHQPYAEHGNKNHCFMFRELAMGTGFVFPCSRHRMGNKNI